jgi:hypothetical protein
MKKQDCQGRTARTGQPGQVSQERAARRGQKKDSPNMTAKTGQAKRKRITGQSGQINSQNRIASQDGQERTARTELSVQGG